MIKRMMVLLLITVVCSVVWVACDTNAQQQDHLTSMHMQEVWKYSSGENQVIAFIDTGITNDAYTLYKGRIVNAYNIIDNSHDVSDAIGHGTEVISLACGDGQKDIVGIAPKAKIMPIKAIGNDGRVDAPRIVKAISYAIDHGASVLNLSFGSHVQNEDVKTVIQTALNKHITVVAAAGDYSQKDLLFPASIAGVISVEALDEKWQVWELSNTSEGNIATFPGVNTLALSLNNKLKPVSGTSYSCALASGYVAVMRAYMEKMGINIVNEKIVRQMQLLNVAKNGRADYVRPIEDFNYHSFVNKFKFMMQNPANIFIPFICVSAVLLIRFFLSRRKDDRKSGEKRSVKKLSLWSSLFSWHQC